MRHIAPTKQQIIRASTLYPFEALTNSIMEGKSNIYGALGEVVFDDAYPTWKRADTRDHDFVSGHGTVDIKTKRTTAVPQGNWNCSVADTSLHQRPDFYFFIRVDEMLQNVWFLGWMPRSEFYEKARFYKKGEADPEMRGWKFRADCWNVRVDQLRCASHGGAG